VHRFDHPPLDPGQVPDADALVLECARAGVIVLGKTNTPEFGCKGVTDNAVFGHTRNPWNLDRVAGGSSGGAAAAVAARLESVVPGRVSVRSGCAGAASLALLGAAVGFGGILLATLAGSAWLSLAPIRYLGRVSYGLYVYHEVALWWVSGSSLGRLLVALAMTIAVAVVSYHFLELPFLRMKARFAPVSFVSDLHHTPVPAAVVAPLGAVTATRDL